MSNLRSCLPYSGEVQPYILVDREVVQFNTESKYSLDVKEFLSSFSLLQLPGKHSDQILDVSFHPDNLVLQLEHVISFYRGHFLEGFSLRDSQEFNDWLSIKREQYHRHAISTLHHLVDGLLLSGNHKRALMVAQRQLDFEPWLEEAHRQIMQLLALDGQRSAALHQYEQCRRLLSKELGVKPSDDTINLYQHILENRLPVIHRAPGFLIEEKLPENSSPGFVARQKELDHLHEVLKLVLAGKGQVQIICGGPGQGKTTLAREFIQQSLDRHHNLVAVHGDCQAYFGKGDPYQPFCEILTMLTGVVEDGWGAGLISTEQARRCWLLSPRTTRLLLEKGPALIGSLIPGEDVFRSHFRTSSVHGEWIDRLSRFKQKYSHDKPVESAEQEGFIFQYVTVIHHISRSVPVLIFLDDLHWADSGTLNLLIKIGRFIQNSRIFILAALRPVDLFTGNSSTARQLSSAISELQMIYGHPVIDFDLVEDSGFVNDFLDLEPNRFDLSFRDRFFEHTRGNPLFTIELYRGLKDKGYIYQDEHGVWVASAGLDWDSFSPRIEAVIQERINRLPKDLLNSFGNRLCVR